MLLQMKFSITSVPEMIQLLNRKSCKKTLINVADLTLTNVKVTSA